MAVTVTDLITYPLKGCAGVPVAEAELGPAGLPDDRAFMVVDTDGVFRSQRTDPSLALIRPEIDPGGGELVLRAPGMAPLPVQVDWASPRREVTLFRRTYRGIDLGEPCARWLSHVLGAPSRLVRVPPEHSRITPGRTPGTSGYADGGPVHLLSRGSLRELNRRIALAGRTPLPMSRFRPNIVVDGWDEPHTEDRAQRLTVGQAVLAFAQRTDRCAVTLVDQAMGVKRGPEPLRTLAEYRRHPGGGVLFGVLHSVSRTGRLAVGNEVTVTEWAPGER